MRNVILEEINMNSNNSSMSLLTRAHIRNLEIQIVRLMLQSSEPDTSFMKRIYSKKQISQEFYFRKKDIHYYLNSLFEKRGTGYVFKEETKEKIQGYIRKHNARQQEYSRVKVDFLKKCEIYFKEVENSLRAYDTDNFDKFKENMNYENIIYSLHWGSLPIYKSEYMEQEELIPEDNIPKYYNDLYTIKDLVKWIRNDEKWKPSFKGDCNLDQDMDFSVYSRRWGHRDCYRIKRTIDGWSIRAIAIHGKSKKNGEGKILENLNHDNIFYPKEEIKEAFACLWSMADESEMTVGELSAKLQDIADWISGIEIACGKYKPSWL